MRRVTRAARGERRKQREETSEAPRPGRITAIEAQARDASRVNVFLDGAFAFGLDGELAASEGLAVDDELSAERVTALQAMDDTSKATEAALRLLTVRPRAEREIRDRLRQKGFGAAAIDATVAKLEGWRYLDDAEFARTWVANREANQPRGRRLLEQELRQKGVEREVVRDTIAAADLDEAQTALDLGRAKLRSYASLDPAVARRRLGSYLARRGYGYDVVRPTLETLFGENEEDAGDEPL
jgi:regulatory protein